MPRQLPTELIRHIIKLALPIVSYGTYWQRYDLLLVFSLVNSTWNALTQEELYKEVFIETGDTLAAVLEGKEGLETLHLRDVILGLNDTGGMVPPLPEGCLFRSLTILSLLNVYLFEGFPTWTTWFHPTNFPHLCRLTLGTVGTFRSLGRDHNLVEALELLAPRIQDLTVTEGYRSGIIFADFPWSAFTTIQRLALYSQVRDQVNLIVPALAEVPAASLSHLLVGYGHGVPNKPSQPLSVWETKLLPTLIQALESRSEVISLGALKVLVLHYGGEAVKRGTSEASGELEAVMKARGGVLERRVAWGQLKEQALWETYLEPW